MEVIVLVEGGVKKIIFLSYFSKNVNGIDIPNVGNPITYGLAPTIIADTTPIGNVSCLQVYGTNWTTLYNTGYLSTEVIPFTVDFFYKIETTTSYVDDYNQIARNFIFRYCATQGGSGSSVQLNLPFKSDSGIQIHLNNSYANSYYDGSEYWIKFPNVNFSSGYVHVELSFTGSIGYFYVNGIKCITISDIPIDFLPRVSLCSYARSKSYWTQVCIRNYALHNGENFTPPNSPYQTPIT